MLNYKIIRVVFGILFSMAILSTDILWISLSAIVFIIVLGIGSFNIQSNFYLSSISKVNTNHKSVILSFDDGPSEATPFILDILKEFKCQAIFFCIGRNIDGREEILRRIEKEGHLIGNHSFSHTSWFDFYSSGRVCHEIEKTNEAIFKVTGLRCRLFRPPYGVTNPMIAKAISQTGHTSIGWSIRSLDTVLKSEEKIINRIIKNIHPGGIILLHDSLTKSPVLLKKLLHAIYDTGYSVERLDKLTSIECYEN